MVVDICAYFTYICAYFRKMNPFDVENKGEMRLLHNEMFKGKSSLSCLQQGASTTPEDTNRS